MGLRYTDLCMDDTTHQQKQYFEYAYRTGSDIWTHTPYWDTAEKMLPPMEKDSLVLDIGVGRGIWAMKMIERGFKVLGIDYIESIVHKVNETITKKGYADRARCITASALNIPFHKQTFNMATDIGILQHLQSRDWKKYTDELVRVLKPAAYYLNISVSRKTRSFLGWHPSTSDTGNFSKFGVNYHFFTSNEIHHIFEDHFVIVDQQFESYDAHSDPQDDIVLVFTLMQKK